MKYDLTAGQCKMIREALEFYRDNKKPYIKRLKFRCKMAEPFTGIELNMIGATIAQLSAGRKI